MCLVHRKAQKGSQMLKDDADCRVAGGLERDPDGYNPQSRAVRAEETLSGVSF